MSGHSELKKAAEDLTKENTCAAANKFEELATPAAVLALISEVEQLKSDSLCPACVGSGEGWIRSDNGPDAHNILVDCPECFGPGTMLGAYQAMKIQRDSQIERTAKAGGYLLFMRAERDQLKAQIEALTATGKFLGAGVDILGPRCDQLKAENEALRKDAERYRWLRDTATGPWMRALDLYARRDKRMDVAIDEEINRMAKP